MIHNAISHQIYKNCANRTLVPKHTKPHFQSNSVKTCLHNGSLRFERRKKRHEIVPVANSKLSVKLDTWRTKQHKANVPWNKNNLFNSQFVQIGEKWYCIRLDCFLFQLLIVTKLFIHSLLMFSMNLIRNWLVCKWINQDAVEFSLRRINNPQDRAYRFGTMFFRSFPYKIWNICIYTKFSFSRNGWLTNK